MLDPKDVFTIHGYREYIKHIENLKDALFFLNNNEDDLELDLDHLDAIWAMQKVAEKLSKYLPR